MAEPVTAVQAGRMCEISTAHVTELCRLGKLRSAHKAHSPMGGQRRWMLDPDELSAYLGKRQARIGPRLPEPWSPRYRKASPAHVTELQYGVLAGEWWHELLDMQLRANGDLWTKWSDGERFVILPNGELDDFRYVWTDREYLEKVRTRASMPDAIPA